MPQDFDDLTGFLACLPALRGQIGTGVDKKGRWWVKFSIDIDHPLAWHVVQELAHVLNYLSLSERLPTRFQPVSGPPYMNGGPREFLGWVIECDDPEFTPALCAEWLEGRLPDPVDDPEEWEFPDDLRSRT